MKSVGDSFSSGPVNHMSNTAIEAYGGLSRWNQWRWSSTEVEAVAKKLTRDYPRLNAVITDA